jgi:hypothetical protein
MSTSATNTTITVPPNGVIAQNDSNGKELKFKELGKDTLQAEGSDGLIYTVQKQVQQAIMSVQKKAEDSSIKKINDPYYQRMAANRPKAKGEGTGTEETTEARETKEFGKPARRSDVNTGAVK